MGYLASTVDVSVEQKLKPEDVLVVQDFVDVFLEDLPSCHLRERLILLLIWHQVLHLSLRHHTGWLQQN